MRRFFGRFWQAIGDYFNDRVPERSRVNYDAEQMLQALDQQANGTSLAMALADEAREKLAAEVSNHESLARQAEEFLRGGGEQAAQRCVALQLQSARQIEKLKAKYLQLQGDAERAAAAFVSKRDSVIAKVRAIPEIQDDLRLIEAQERLQRMTAAFSVENAERSFDNTVREIEVRKRQLANRDLITADPNAELDARIRQNIGEREVADAMEALRKKVAESGDVIEAEFKMVEDSVSQAQKALETPRYRGVLPASLEHSKLPVKRST